MAISGKWRHAIPSGSVLHQQKAGIHVWVLSDVWVIPFISFCFAKQI
jgi:hypothetical protein